MGIDQRAVELVSACIMRLITEPAVGEHFASMERRSILRLGVLTGWRGRL
jgi:hypothetical protein